MGAGLLLTTCAAFSATAYAVCSCRFIALTFQTDQGGFENHFANSPVTDGVWNSFKASLGLFQWLRPLDVLNWSEGACVGYQESMLNVIQDDMFDIARSFAVISVLMGVICSLWAIVSACIAWNWLQITILRVLLFIGTVSAGLSMLILNSGLCETAIPAASCTLDEGGMVLIAGIILWTSAFIISTAFIRSFSKYEIEMQGTADVDDVFKARRAGEIAARRAAMMKEQERRRKELEMKEHERRRKELAKMAEASNKQMSPKTPATAKSFSYDSDDSLNSYQNRQRGVKYLKEEQSLQPSQKSRKSQQSTALTVDDISHRNELEVYITEKMQRINNLMDSMSNTDTSAEVS